MLNRALLLFAALLVLGLPRPSAATPAPDFCQKLKQGGKASAALDVCTTLEERDRKIKSLLKNPKSLSAQQRGELGSYIAGLIDFEAMGRQALGSFWNKLTAAQRQSFLGVFSDIVEAQSLSDLEVYNAKVTYQDVRVVGDSAYVKTVTLYKNTPTSVDYVLGRKNKLWRARDIILDEVSTAGGYERSFQTVLRKKGFDYLMQSLIKKRDTLAASR